MSGRNDTAIVRFRESVNGNCVGTYRTNVRIVFVGLVGTTAASEQPHIDTSVSFGIGGGTQVPHLQ